MVLHALSGVLQGVTLDNRTGTGIDEVPIELDGNNSTLMSLIPYGCCWLVLALESSTLDLFPAEAGVPFPFAILSQFGEACDVPALPLASEDVVGVIHEEPGVEGCCNSSTLLTISCSEGKCIEDDPFPSDAFNLGVDAVPSVPPSSGIAEIEARVRIAGDGCSPRPEPGISPAAALFPALKCVIGCPLSALMKGCRISSIISMETRFASRLRNSSSLARSIVNSEDEDNSEGKANVLCPALSCSPGSILIAGHTPVDDDGWTFLVQGQLL